MPARHETRRRHPCLGDARLLTRLQPPTLVQPLPASEAGFNPRVRSCSLATLWEKSPTTAVTGRGRSTACMDLLVSSCISRAAIKSSVTPGTLTSAGSGPLLHRPGTSISRPADCIAVGLPRQPRKTRCCRHDQSGTCQAWLHLSVVGYVADHPPPPNISLESTADTFVNLAGLGQCDTSARSVLQLWHA